MQLARLLCLTWLACSAGLLCKAMAVPHGAYDGSDHTVVERQLDFPVYSTCKELKQIALTFDDGPAAYTESLSSTLGRSSGSFFVNGHKRGCIYDPQSVAGLEAAHRAGHDISSHTWSHVDTTTLTESQFNDQLAFVETALKRILGITPALFRPPFGKYNDMNLKVLKKRGYRALVLWDYASGDNASKSSQESVHAYQSLARTFPHSHIALNHETKRGTARKFIPAVTKDLLRWGYQLVTVSQCIGVEPYQAVTKPKNRDKTWTCAGLPDPGQKD